MTSLDTLLTEATSGDRPVASAAVAMVSIDGDVVAAFAGVLSRAHGDGGVPPAPTSMETRFDLASITKLFTAAALLVALDERGLRDHDLVADVLPEFRDGRARATTFADLLRHTAGWPAEWPDRVGDDGAWRRFRSAMPVATPGDRHRYSCVGYIWAGLAAEAVAGERLDAVVRRVILEPLGLHETGFAPEAALRASIAATEVQPPRGLVHGEVHDETAWTLGGIAGNAGLFGTAADLLRFAELLRRGGTTGSRRVLPEWVVEAMTTDRLPSAVGERPPYGQALGPRIADAAWMGSLAARGAIGHTGFTGTSLLTVPGGAHSVIILTNRVHPSRHGPDLGALRRRIADDAAHL